MTTNSLSAFPCSGKLAVLLAFGRTRAGVIGLCVVLVATASAIVAPRPANGTAAPRLPAMTSTRPADGAVTALRAAAPNSSRQIEVLANVIARKYRISRDATRVLVDAAYREGERNGIDPLLIIAVIAVESRFNPIAQSDGGAVGLMQVIPRYHSDKFDPTAGESVLDPHTNIQVGARVLKEYIRRGGSQIAGLQLYNGASGDASNSYANRVLGEKQRMQDAIRRAGDRARA